MIFSASEGLNQGGDADEFWIQQVHGTLQSRQRRLRQTPRIDSSLADGTAVIADNIIDDAARKQLRRLLLWGFGISLLVHLMLGQFLGHIRYRYSEVEKLEPKIITVTRKRKRIVKLRPTLILPRYKRPRVPQHKPVRVRHKLTRLPRIPRHRTASAPTHFKLKAPKTTGIAHHHRAENPYAPKAGVGQEKGASIGRDGVDTAEGRAAMPGAPVVYTGNFSGFTSASGRNCSYSRTERGKIVITISSSGLMYVAIYGTLGGSAGGLGDCNVYNGPTLSTGPAAGSASSLSYSSDSRRFFNGASTTYSYKGSATNGVLTDTIISTDDAEEILTMQVSLKKSL